MTCKCIGNKCSKVFSMECKKCNNKQFYTKRVEQVATAYVCSKCGNEISIKKKNKKEAE